MERFFGSVRGSPKNKVTLLGELMDEYQLKPEEMVFVGDAETDWLAARETGVPFIWSIARELLVLLIIRVYDCHL